MKKLLAAPQTILAALVLATFSSAVPHKQPPQPTPQDWEIRWCPVVIFWQPCIPIFKHKTPKPVPCPPPPTTPPGPKGGV